MPPPIARRTQTREEVRRRGGTQRTPVATTSVIYDDDEREFLVEIERYKRRNRRPFPTWSEVLDLLRSLGYRKVAERTKLPDAPGNAGNA